MQKVHTYIKKSLREFYILHGILKHKLPTDSFSFVQNISGVRVLFMGDRNAMHHFKIEGFKKFIDYDIEWLFGFADFHTISELVTHLGDEMERAEGYIKKFTLRKILWMKTRRFFAKMTGY